MHTVAIGVLAALMLLARPIIGIQLAAADERPVLKGDRAAYAVCASWSDYSFTPNLRFQVPDSARGAYNWDCQLWPNDEGDGVFILQDALRRCYGQNIKHDGNYGPATTQAVRNVQAFHRLPTDGVYGRETNLAMAYPKYRRDNGAYDKCWYP